MYSFTARRYVLQAMHEKDASWENVAAKAKMLAKNAELDAEIDDLVAVLDAELGERI